MHIVHRYACRQNTHKYNIINNLLKKEKKISWAVVEHNFDPLSPPGRQRPLNLCVQGWHSLKSEFKDSHGYRESPVSNRQTCLCTYSSIAVAYTCNISTWETKALSSRLAEQTVWDTVFKRNLEIYSNTKKTNKVAFNKWVCFTND